MVVPSLQADQALLAPLSPLVLLSHLAALRRALCKIAPRLHS